MPIEERLSRIDQEIALLQRQAEQSRTPDERNDLLARAHRLGTKKSQIKAEQWRENDLMRRTRLDRPFGKPIGPLAD
jgi:hypothetical protein